MRFGHFDDAKREYVIETPRTPLPWIDYLGSEDFLRWCPTQPAVTPSTGMPVSAV